MSRTQCQALESRLGRNWTNRAKKPPFVCGTRMSRTCNGMEGRGECQDNLSLLRHLRYQQCLDKPYVLYVNVASLGAIL